MPLTVNQRLPAALAVALALGCSARSPPPAGDTGSAAGAVCLGCHGSAQGSAPPVSTKGTTATSDVRVGAHQSHLGPNPYRKPIACDECHVVPASEGSPGHIDANGDHAQVVFGFLAKANGAAPQWDGARCSATYCHGATLAGGRTSAPEWTKVDGTQVGCGSCHGAPPPLASGHPAVTGTIPAACSTCHPGTVAPDGTILLGGGQHIDGTVQIGAAACTGCHGDPARLPAAAAPAPPRDTLAQTSTSLVSVGAHARHLVGTTLRSAPVPCAECHEVPDNLLHHPDGNVDITFGPLARAGGAIAQWQHASATCAVYCHGATLSGGAAGSPVWTRLDGSQVSCGACHGNPPPPPHPANAQCGTCHLGYTNATVDPVLHIDGYVELDLKTCTSCHGTSARPLAIAPAPPPALSGETATSALGVGAHQAHLTGTALSRPIACTECHPDVTRTDHAAGRNLVRQVTFGPLASSAGAFPRWNRATATCSSTYCHGATLAGGRTTTPVWNVVDGSQKQCDSCHGNPPPAPHVARNDCDSCHPGYSPTRVVPATHIDGVVDATDLRCTTCHGDATRTPAWPAPPLDTHGQSAVTSRGVGAHAKHLTDGPLRRAVACTECHVVPTVMNHATGTATVTFGPLAVTGVSAPRWDGATCSGVYCHGATLGGGTLTAPTWTRVDGTQAACGTCHGNPPPAPHPQSLDCGGCHAGYTATSVNLGSHLDGVVQASGSCTSCHGDPAATGDAAAAPPRDSNGNTSTQARGVGAHQAHVASRLGPPVGCGECHPPTDPVTHPEGTVAVVLGPISRGGGAAPVWKAGPASCAATYCHGATLKGGVDPEPVWTRVNGTSSACDACHGDPPPTASHTGMTRATSCGTCHPGFTSSTVDPVLHVNGVVDANGLSCTSCHGNPARTGPGASAPPRDTAQPPNTQTTARGVGAHQVHLGGGALRGGIACTECHPVPPDLTAHPSGAVEMAFGPLARAGGAAPAWNRTALTCASVYCHGSSLTGGTLRTPGWTTVNGTQAACGTCHGLPPPRPHVQRTTCGACHPGYTATTVSLGAHVNGVVDTVALSCTTCHGDPARVLVTGADPAAAAAPPVDTTGASGASLRSVGAHLAHLNRGAGALAKPTACAECHVVPSSNAHADGIVAVSFGTLARTGGAVPGWNGTTCASTYCHGKHANGLAAAPSWTATGPLDCTTSCHARTPATCAHTMKHDASGGACNGCHKDTDATGTKIVNASLHVNGRVDGVCTDCHNGQVCR
jgi:predicted CxxxxCH...CXXCH cytochrome family protein